MATQTGLMVRRVVVSPDVVVAGGVDARRNSRRTHFTTLQLRHCTTLAQKKKEKLHNELESTLYYTNTFEYRLLDG